MNTSTCAGCGRFPRRTFLSDVGMGFAGMALGSMLWRDGIVRAKDEPKTIWAPPTGQPMFAPRAKSVIWIFLSGGYSQLETFDPKPALNHHAGKIFDQIPLKNPLPAPNH